jgi:protein O-mannosyl-transferase
MKPASPTLHAVLLVAILAVAALVYRAGLSGGFQYDDAGNIEFNAAVHLTSLSVEGLERAAFSGGAGPLKRPLSMASFALNHYYAGPAPYGYKVVNLAIHLTTGAVLYWLAWLLIRAHARGHDRPIEPSGARWLALGAASAWLLHPLALTSVLYVVQRMTSLATLFTALGLVGYLLARERLPASPRAAWAAALSLAVFTPLAAACKETGLLLPLYALVCEGVLLRFGATSPGEGRAVRRIFGVAVGLPALAIAACAAIDPDYVLSGYGAREFDLTQRLLTEARVLWTYARMILVPDVRQMGLYHDDYAVSTALDAPSATLPAVAALAAAVALAWVARRRLPWLAFAVLFFLAGHLMESTVFALDLMHEHRNYLPMFGVLLAVVASLGNPGILPDTVKLRAVLVAAIVAVLGGVTALRASDWSNPITLAEMEVAHHPGSPRANYEAARQYDFLLRRDKNPIVAEIDFRYALKYIYDARQARSDFAPAIVGRILLEADHGTRPDDAWFAEARAALSRGVPTPDLVDVLRALADCQRDGPCALSDTEAASLYEAVLANPRLKGRALAAVLTSASDYMATRPRNLVNALSLARAAVQAAPGDPRYRLNLAILLIADRQFDAARTEIAAAKGLDDFRVYAREIREHEARLATLSRGGRV